MIKDNINQVLFQIKEAAQRCGRNPSEITLVCASKYVDSDKIKEAFSAGIKAFGENKIQDARQKYEQLKDLEIEWHMIGHLQTNKARDAVKLFSLIHSVDSLGLAKEIDKQAAKINKIQDILIEVNTTGEGQKYGTNSDEIIDLVKDVLQLKNLRLKGLMTMGKLVDNPEVNRQYFRRLRELNGEINKYLQSAGSDMLSTLSMGMTDDFEVAIAEGSNMVRVGRAIWGE